MEKIILVLLVAVPNLLSAQNPKKILVGKEWSIYKTVEVINSATRIYPDTCSDYSGREFSQKNLLGGKVKFKKNSKGHGTCRHFFWKVKRNTISINEDPSVVILKSGY
ncbi:hypothetical protein JYT72_00945 [Crocinitomix catalasitica]|nr:hypothetical protein [Crocinitomix catalasitica]